MYTTQPIISHSKGNIYAPQNAEVTVLHYSGHVAICEYEGNRFPCHRDLLSESPVVVEVVVPTKKKLSAKDAQLIELYEKMKK